MSEDGDQVASPKKMGRKGDPRMHKALEARVNDPRISLIDALQIGGFEFYSLENNECYDRDNILLSQRKNQLSRRIRLYKKQNQLKQSLDKSASRPLASTSTTPFIVTGSSGTGRKVPNRASQGPKSVATRDHDIDPSTNSRKPNEKNATAKVRFRHAYKKQGPMGSGTSQGISGAFPHTRDLDISSSVAARFAQINPLGMSKAADMSSHVAVASGIIAPPNISFSSRREMRNGDNNMSQALDLYNKKSKELIKSSMLEAGFSPSYIQGCDDYFLNFKKSAMKREESVQSSFEPLPFLDSNNLTQREFLMNTTAEWNLNHRNPTAVRSSNRVHSVSAVRYSNQNWMLHLVFKTYHSRLMILSYFFILGGKQQRSRDST
jgi:hypothetical protein